MKNIIHGFLLALQFLTRIPVPVECPWSKETSRWALRSYPIVGIIIGYILYLTFVLLEPHISLGILAFIILSGWVWLTGALHLDGWMDVADAVGSNAPLEKRWEIMKDPHVGSFGIVALLFLLAWKVIFIYAMVESSIFAIYSFIVIAGLSRFGAVLLLAFMPTAKETGLAWEWKKNINGWDAFFAVLPLSIVFLFLPKLLFLLPAYLLFLVLYGWWVKRNFNGTNGDLLGTVIEGGELWGLAVTWIYISFVMG